jgi:homotetrameric cytidine deaminase
VHPADETARALHARAETARERAYAPYSAFTVGAALLTDGGEIVTGGNVENGSYGMTICAERAAVVRAIAEGHRRFAAIAIAGPADSVQPCGACRQVLSEFAEAGFLVTFPLAGALVTYTIDELLPSRFTLR